MTSSRPYLLRALYEWLLDNQLTPYIMVDASIDTVRVPKAFVKDGKIVLNIAPPAVKEFELTNQFLSFNAYFSGVVHHLHVPIMAIGAIYSFENGRGMVFSAQEEEDDPPPSGGETDVVASPGKESTEKKPGKGSRPHLTVVK